MSVSGTVLDYINGLKWPVVAAGFGYYFRKPISGILRKIHESDSASVTGPGGIGVRFWSAPLMEAKDELTEEALAQLMAPLAIPAADMSDLQETGRELQELLAAGTAAGGQVHIDDDKDWRPIYALLNASPSRAVIEAWQRVENALRERVTAKGMSPELDGQALIVAATLPSNVEDAVAKLSALYKTVAVLRLAPSKAEADEFVSTAQLFTMTLPFVDG